jgi:hypothetical protein
MNIQLDILRSYVDGLLENEGLEIPDDYMIDKAISALKNTPLFNNTNSSALKDLISQEYSSFFEEEAKIIYGKNQDHIQWLNETTGKGYHREIEFNYWDDYKRFLKKEQNFPKNIINGVDKQTNLILAAMDDPIRDGKWDRRGMVVGEVQSGKTSNYSGLICKAADAGYGVIIVFAGMFNDLRSQTQERLDKGFIGFDTSRTDPDTKKLSYRIGVGKFTNPVRKGGPILCHTTTKEDFSKTVSRSAGIPVDSSDPIILVVKKNKSVIDNLNFWVGRNILDYHEHIMNTSLLIIDDECDNASINTKKYDAEDNEYDTTTINNGIRLLLKQFIRSAYVGYTATPYANVLINRETEHVKYGNDLFPQDFIINLPTPTNHIGPSTVFGMDGDAELGLNDQEGLPLINYVFDIDTLLPDFREMKKNVLIPSSLSPSLREAFLSFILSCAGRLYRGHDSVHNSFLIHASFYVNVHRQLREHLEDFRGKIYNRIMNASSSDFYWKELEKLWNSNFVDISSSMYMKGLGKVHSWADILPFIKKSIERLEVISVNGESKDALDYAELEKQKIYKNFVTVGGNRLSRGLTLEGLNTSYFLRSSNMYDTLMQMGRWFGYRNDYLDLCRLYTTTNIVNAYRHIALATTELRQEFDYMHERREKPKDWGLKVRSHPGVLMVTGFGKRRWGHRVRLNLSAKLLQTHNVFTDQKNCLDNYKSLRHVINNYKFSLNDSKTAYLCKNVSSESICDFIDGYRLPSSGLWKPKVLTDYINKKTQESSLTSWTVAILNSNQNDLNFNNKINLDSQPKMLIDGLGDLRLTGRNGELDNNVINFSKSYVSSRHEWIFDYSNGQIKNIETKHSRKMNGILARKERPSRNGLLLIYPIYGAVFSLNNIQYTSNKIVPSYGLDYDFPVIAPAISFSGKAIETDEEYFVDELTLKTYERES